ncbi:hypothetical protein Pint_03767 [Pistacia integerrima]|uniref:Uncharacterized protein n=1 Tax=Pistacia integerrima TaxID=434235 RepID=A0ACC0Z7F2_9ROSI|nr:hypothetical protein Pint_03767 [Pistacia integerrima]
MYFLILRPHTRFNALIVLLFQIIKRLITNGGGEIWGQHPCGIGVPAVAMGFPGYVAQPQLALGNSEMIWLPLLVGATYCPPYIVVVGAFHPCTLGRSDIFDWFLKVSSVISAISLFQIIKTPIPSGGGENAVGMTFAGYVAQPQLVLAGAAVTLGATYCPPYIVVDGAYHLCSLGQTSSTGSSRGHFLVLEGKFGGQHPCDIGVLAVGMVFPGYVAQPQLLAVLAGAAGALGTTYYPPYIAVDGAYHPCSLGRTSLTGSSRLLLRC